MILDDEEIKALAAIERARGKFMIIDDEEIKALAAIERAMDAGTQPYVKNRGQRWAFPKEIMEDLDFVSGQNVSDHLLMVLLGRGLDYTRIKMAIHNARSIDDG